MVFPKTVKMKYLSVTKIYKSISKEQQNICLPLAPLVYTWLLP